VARKNGPTAFPQEEVALDFPEHDLVDRFERHCGRIGMSPFDSNATCSKKNKWIALNLMVWCLSADLVLGIIVDGNGSFLGLSDKLSLAIYAGITSVGVVAAAYVCFRLPRWRPVAIIIIAVHAVLFAPLLVP
jgi:hypothetical protein